MRLLMSCLLLFTCLSVTARANDLRPILSLELQSDDDVLQDAVLYASDIDPNSRGTSDRYRFVVDGVEVPLPDALLGRLDTGRRGYSYDAFTNGVSEEVGRIRCMMGGPARGWVLSVRYLQYDRAALVGSDMRPILTEAGNCLFTHRIRPVSDEAMRAATGALATLRTLIELHAR